MEDGRLCFLTFLCKRNPAYIENSPSAFICIVEEMIRYSSFLLCEIR